MTRYAALLRGIGPANPNMRNERLRGVVEGLGFREVETVISSGNVLFEADSSDVDALEAQLQAAWPAELGFESTTIVRSREQLERLVAAEPFGDREDTESSRLQATFLKRAPDRRIEVPQTSPDGASEIVAVVDRTICSTVDLSGSGTPDLMRWLERTFGKEITTRTWKTVHRLVRRMG